MPRRLSAVALLSVLAGCAAWIPDYETCPLPAVVVLDEPGLHAVVELYPAGRFPDRAFEELGTVECPNRTGIAGNRQLAEGAAALGGDGVYGIHLEEGVLTGVVFRYLTVKYRPFKPRGWCATR